MKYFILSDIHIDFYSVQTKNYDTILPNFEEQYQKNFLPADGIIVAGDIANDYNTQVMFYKFLSQKYKEVYIVFGNHDIIVSGATFGNGNPFKKSEEKMSAIQKEFMHYPNVHILENPNLINGFGGCMGQCDLNYNPYNIQKSFLIIDWTHNWFDGRHWNYMNNNWQKIWNHYHDKMLEIVKQHPKVMVTHFCPIELGMNSLYKNNTSSAFFYFEGKEFLEEMENDTYWICGHTHDSWKVDYKNTKGNVIHILCNPMGYPKERPYDLNDLTKEDFLIEI